MNATVSAIIFVLTLLIYIHIRHYHAMSADYDIIILNDIEHLNIAKSFHQLLEDSGRAKLPCVFKNTDGLENLNTNFKMTLNYLNLLEELGDMKLCVPFRYDDDKTNDKSSTKNIYLTIEATTFGRNDVNVEGRALFYNDKMSNNKQLINDKQRRLLNAIYGCVDTYANKYLYNQYISRQTHTIYFSNYASKTYIEFQTYKNPLNIFYVLDGECEVVIAHPDCIKKELIREDYVFFKFYYEKNVFENGNLKAITREGNDKINTIKCNRGDVILLPSKWYISIEMGEGCVILNESVSTLTSAVSLAPDYLKNLMYRSTIKMVPNHISEVIEEEDEKVDEKVDEIVDDEDNKTNDVNDGVKTDANYENTLTVTDDNLTATIVHSVESEAMEDYGEKEETIEA